MKCSIFFFTIRQLKSTKNACHSIGKYFSCLIKKILRENKYDVHIHKYLGSLKACNRNIWAFWFWCCIIRNFIFLKICSGKNTIHVFIVYFPFIVKYLCIKYYTLLYCIFVRETPLACWLKLSDAESLCSVFHILYA